MLVNNIKMGFRSLLKQKAFSVINIFGLVIGLTGCLLILQYVSFELSYDKFHDNSEDIYRVTYSKEKNGVESFHTVLTYIGVGPALKQNFPEVIDFARLRPTTSLVTIGDNTYEEQRTFFADPSYLKIFSFNMLDGNPETALDEQFSAVITESTARKYYGSANPIGQTFRRGRNETYVVTGVVEDVPLNAHIKWDFILSHSTMAALRGANYDPNNMTTFYGHLYILTQPGTTTEQLTAKFPQFVNDFVWSVQTKPEDTEMFLHAMPLEDIHLNSNVQHEAEVNGDQSTVTYLIIIAFMILFIAWVNYVNLATARAAERAKEIGVRKVLGSLKSQLIKQFLTEAAITNFLAIGMALVLVSVSQKLFVVLNITEMPGMTIWGNPLFWPVIIGLWLLGVICSGFYPAMVMSSYKPISVLRGSFYGNRRGIVLRKVLVIFQFASSIALLIGTAVVFLQIGHMRNKDLGVNLDQAIVVQAPRLIDSTYVSRIRSFATELKRDANIQSVVATSDVPGREVNGATWFRKIEDDPDDGVFSLSSMADHDYVESLEINLLAGRNFTPQDNDRIILINEEASLQLGFPNPQDAVNKQITFAGGDGSFRMTIAGVMSNYHQLSPKVEHNPQIIRYSPTVRRYYIVKFNTGANPDQSIRQVISQSENTYKRLFPGNPFSYFFLDEEFERQYESDKQFGDIFGIFSILAILVACLGLFGLAAHTIIQKTKEIGIRKVLGSSIVNILRTLSWEYVKLIVIANLIAWPLIYYLMNRWLDTFVTRIEVQWWLFPAACILVMVIALVTVSFHTIKAARANPVKSLRYE